MEELHVHAIADIHTVEATDHPPLDRGVQKAYPGPLRGSARDDGLEAVAEARLEQHRGRGFADEPFDLARVVRSFRAAPGQLQELLPSVRNRSMR